MRPVAPTLQLMPAPAGRLLSLAEVRARMPAPPSEPILWRVTTIGVPRRETTAIAQLWWDARLLGALKLGVLPEQCSCKPADEIQIRETQEERLGGNGAA